MVYIFYSTSLRIWLTAWSVQIQSAFLSNLPEVIFGPSSVEKTTLDLDKCLSIQNVLIDLWLLPSVSISFPHNLSRLEFFWLPKKMTLSQSCSLCFCRGYKLHFPWLFYLMFYWSIALNEQCVINIYDNFLHSNFNINERYYLHITSNFYLMLSIVYALWQTIRIITWFIIMGFNFFKYKYELDKTLNQHVHAT